MLAVTAVLFAFSTMISWSYYGEQCWVWLFGLRSIHLYKLVFLVFAFLGAMFEAGSVLDFGDLMILGMAFPNILGVVLLSGKVKAPSTTTWPASARGRSHRPSPLGSPQPWRRRTLPAGQIAVFRRNELLHNN